MQRQPFLLIVLFATGCPKSGGPHGRPTESGGPAVVTFADHSISTAEFQKQFNEQSPFVRSHYQTLEKKKEFLETIIQNDLLADEALKAGFDKDDEVLDEFKKSMIQAWIKAKFNDQDGMKSIPDSAIHEFYDAHHDEYQRPERLRVQMVLFQSARGGDAKAKAEAEQALKVLTTKKDVSAFAELARTRSDDPTSKMRGGDLDFHTHDELAKAYGDEVAKAADALRAPNDLSGVAHGTQGYVLLRLEARQPAFNRSFEQVEASLRSRLWNEKRTKIFDDYIKDLMEKSHIKIDDEQLAKIDPNQPGALSDDASPALKTPGTAPRPLPPATSQPLHTPLTPLHAAPPMKPSNAAQP
jgi:peptidyl-prolyl cis-trans isomerase C